MTKLRERLNSASGVIALVALFVALGGSAYALQAHSVGTRELKNKAVTRPKLAPGAVTPGRIHNGAVTTPKLHTQAVTTSRIGLAAVTAGRIANGAVTTPKIANGAIRAPQFAPSIPAVGVTRTSDLTIPGGGFLTPIAFTEERYDTANMHNTLVNSSRLTAPIDGIYEVEGSVYWGTSTTGHRIVGLYKNGGTGLGDNAYGPSPAGFTRQTISRVVRLEQGDFVRLLVGQTSGGSLAIRRIPEASPEFTMTWLAPGP